MGRHHLIGPDGEPVIGASSDFGRGGQHALGRQPAFPETDPDSEPDDAPTVRFYGREWDALIETALLDPFPSVQDIRTQAINAALNRDSMSPTEIPLDPTDPAELRRLLDSLRRWTPHPPKHRKG